MDGKELLDMSAIAEHFGVTKEAVRAWRKREYLSFPDPTVKGSAANSTPLWEWNVIRIWALEHRPKLL